MRSSLFYLIMLCVSALISYAETPGIEMADAGRYTLTTCPVSGETLGEMGEPVVKVYDGREVKFCCDNCLTAFEKDLTASFEKLNKELAAAQKPDYALTTCVVSGEPLGGMGEPYEHFYLNRLVMFCCGGCVAAFNKEPEKFLAKLDEAASAKSDPKEEKHE